MRYRLSDLPPEIRKNIRVVKHRDGSTGWVWKGRVNESGYSVVKYDGKWHYGHRLVWKLLVGPIKNGHQLHHKCHVRNCVYPGCLMPVTKTQHKMITWLERLAGRVNRGRKRGVRR